MLKLHIRNTQTTTVSEMRRALARHLATLDGARKVQFEFKADLDTRIPDFYDMMAEKWGVDRATAKARVLGEAYRLGVDLNSHAEVNAFKAPYYRPHNIATTITVEDGM